ncbi:hypothetical protein AYI68_g8348 [Smittium mucronatum]|uniref:Uncharacterized protein n=1 Tax=Smittium mucronatum TaxID=133383 RepID=A0A1R0GL55_9FUNG|nr:hypothetical protein AYI68_g8348 [Smittium mucronatum]
MVCDENCKRISCIIVSIIRERPEVHKHVYPPKYNDKDYKPIKTIEILHKITNCKDPESFDEIEQQLEILKLDHKFDQLNLCSSLPDDFFTRSYAGQGFKYILENEENDSVRKEYNVKITHYQKKKIPNKILLIDTL